ncbi:MAG: hypothetical protein KBB55_04140 [Candidatus Buchananbacteria bacterium]|nr:hypothetical protein [Candidatus Buchananbacteria bacterium]
MSGINLLPEDLRRREQKEVEKQHRSAASVSYSTGQPLKPTPPEGDRLSWWQRVTNRQPKKVSAPKIPSASPVNSAAPSLPPRPKPEPAPAPVKLAAPQPEKMAANIVRPSLTPATGKVAVVKPPKNSWRQIFRSWAVTGIEPKPEPVNKPKAHHSRSAKEHEPAHKSENAAPAGVHINFLPQELLRHRRLDSHQQFTLIIGALIIGILVTSIATFGAVQFERQALNQLEREQDAVAILTKNIVTLEGQQAGDVRLEGKLIAIESLLRGHVRWSRFFAQLEKYTLDGVYYGELHADISGELVVPAVATDYETAARQLVALQCAPDFVKTAEVSSLRLATDGKKGVIGVAFDLKLVLADKLLTQ